MTGVFMWRIDCFMRRYAWWRKWRGLPEPTISPIIEAIVREALAVMRDEPFLARVDAKFARTGEGKTIRVRAPNQYVRRTKA